jgi:RNA polymerase sigma-70 factor (ECF subfamily)
MQTTPGTEHQMDPVLVDRAKHGDKEAFTLIFLRLGGRLYSVAYGILRDSSRADDAVQQALLNAWRQLPRLRDDSRLEAWLFRLVVNACYTELRHTRRWQPGLRLVTDLDAGPAADDTQLSVARRDELERGFRHLSGEHRAVLVMHYYLGLSAPEIGESLGLSASTVRSRLHYARQRMRAAIEADSRAAVSGGAS